LKITRIQTFLTLPTSSADGWSKIKPFLFVRLQTSDGIVGWGEAFTLDQRERGIEQIILSLGGQLMSCDDITPRAFRQLAKSIEACHPGLDYACAVSAIEIALWDLLGKLLNVPVHQLLGGALKKEIPLYANTWSEQDVDIQTLVDRCSNWVEQGYKAVKTYPLKYGSAIRAGECMKALRHSLGNDIEILLDLSTPHNPYLSLETAREVAPYRPYWFEEPVSGEYLDVLSDLRLQSGLRIVTGEKHAGKAHFRDVLKLRAADILNPDIAGCGGILDMLEIGAMAEAHAVFVSPHCWDSMTVALAAMLQVCAVMPNAELAEIYPDYIAHGNQFCRTGFSIQNGVAILGETPGIGVDIDETELVKIATTRSV
jgi:galactonate dehydratase